MNILFKISVAVNGIAVLIALYFIISEALMNYYTSNGVLKLITILYIGLIVFAFYLKENNHLKIATIIMCIPAMPVFLTGLFLLLIIIIKPDWK